MDSKRDKPFSTPGSNAGEEKITALAAIGECAELAPCLILIAR
jgi:hypothetical protein